VDTDRKEINEVVAATAAVKAAFKTAFTDQTGFVMKVMKMVNAVEASVTSEQFAVAA
jgi:hypothetical protein